MSDSLRASGITDLLEAPGPGIPQRHDRAAEKRFALDAWAARVMAVVAGRTDAPNVVTLVRANPIIGSER
jgi:hypothetical protein